MAENLIFAEQNIDGFGLDSSFGLYAKGDNAQFELVAGQRYKVIWDETVHTCTAFDFDMNEFAGVGIGNEGYVSGETTEIVEPFFIAFVETSNYNTFIAADGSTSASHKVAIYQVIETVDIVLKDRNGNPVEYPGVERIRVNTVDGGTAEYVHTSQIPQEVETTVNLDFSSGDMVATPANGQTFSKVNIPVPENLTPENIAEGMNIAGIIGTLAGGGGVASKALVYTAVRSLSVTPTSSSYSYQLVTADTLAAAGIDLMPYISWYVSGQEYIPYIRLTKLYEFGSPGTTTYNCITDAWVSTIGHKPSSGTQIQAGAAMYNNASGVHQTTPLTLSTLSTKKPLEEYGTGAYTNHLFHVENGHVYLRPYYSSSTRYTLVGTYLITVMLIPTK